MENIQNDYTLIPTDKVSPEPPSNPQATDKVSGQSHHIKAHNQSDSLDLEKHNSKEINELIQEFAKHQTDADSPPPEFGPQTTPEASLDQTLDRMLEESGIEQDQVDETLTKAQKQIMPGETLDAAVDRWLDELNIDRSKIERALVDKPVPEDMEKSSLDGTEERAAQFMVKSADAASQLSQPIIGGHRTTGTDQKIQTVVDKVGSDPADSTSKTLSGRATTASSRPSWWARLVSFLKRVNNALKVPGKRKTETERALDKLTKVNPLSTRFQEIVSGYAAENAACKSAFTKLAYEILDTHEQIHDTLRATGKLPANIVEREQSIGLLLGEVIGTIQLENADDKKLSDFQLFNAESNQGLTNLSIVRNIQIFSDTSPIGGLSVKKYEEIIGPLPQGGKLTRHYGREVPYENREKVTDALGYYVKQMDVGDNKQVLGKADWKPGFTEQVEGVKPYLKKGSVTIGKAFYDVEKNEWGPIREIDVELDLIDLKLNEEQTEAYFKLFELVGEEKKQIEEFLNENLTVNKALGNKKTEIIEHFYEFGMQVNRALYLTQYAILYPEESYEQWGVKTRSISEIEAST